MVQGPGCLGCLTRSRRRCLAGPRLTQDIDVLVDAPEDRWPDIITAARPFDIEPRVSEPLEFSRRARVLLLRHGASQIDIDVILGVLPFEREAVSMGQSHSVGPFNIRLPRVEDLMIMKAVAQRPRDMIDLEALLEAHPEADLEQVRRWVREFATASSMPDLIVAFDKLVAQVRSRG